jgi:hypothetical protein
MHQVDDALVESEECGGAVKVTAVFGGTVRDAVGREEFGDISKVAIL